ncbi:MAG: hypothetical protein WBK55_00350 [Alphaproteobacteria bacterium]
MKKARSGTLSDTHKNADKPVEQPTRRALTSMSIVDLVSDAGPPGENDFELFSAYGLRPE